MAPVRSDTRAALVEYWMGMYLRLLVFLGDAAVLSGDAFSLLAALVFGAVALLLRVLLLGTSASSEGGHSALFSLLIDLRADFTGDLVASSKSVMSCLYWDSGAWLNCSIEAHVFCDSLIPCHLIWYTVWPFMVSFLRTASGTYTSSLAGGLGSSNSESRNFFGARETRFDPRGRMFSSDTARHREHAVGDTNTIIRGKAAVISLGKAGTSLWHADKEGRQASSKPHH